MARRSFELREIGDLAPLWGPKTPGLIVKFTDGTSTLEGGLSLEQVKGKRIFESGDIARVIIVPDRHDPRSAHLTEIYRAGYMVWPPNEERNFVKAFLQRFPNILSRSSDR